MVKRRTFVLPNFKLLSEQINAIETKVPSIDNSALIVPSLEIVNTPVVKAVPELSEPVPSTSLLKPPTPSPEKLIPKSPKQSVKHSDSDQLENLMIGSQQDGNSFNLNVEEASSIKAAPHELQIDQWKLTPIVQHVAKVSHDESSPELDFREPHNLYNQSSSDEDESLPRSTSPTPIMSSQTCVSNSKWSRIHAVYFFIIFSFVPLDVTRETIMKNLKAAVVNSKSK
ncbi:hypothetical protein RCL1_002737 [Eukaryota sp. TZLM3-RCL]